jgi:uncharacterized protein DUF6526
MAEQNYANHRRFVPMLHGVLSFLLLLTLIGSCVNLYLSFGDHQRLYSASLIVVLTLCGVLLFWFTRTFSCKAQDRAIRAEENFRHFVLTGKPLDSRLRIGQIVALRFAPDVEFVPLARRAADESLPPDDIKRAVKIWRPDHDRV